MEITWNQPYDGNSGILNYIVQYKLVACKFRDKRYYQSRDVGFMLNIVISPALWQTDPAKVIVAGTQTVTVIEGLTPATSYHIRVVAENSIGLSEPSDEAQAITQEESNYLF